MTTPGLLSPEITIVGGGPAGLSAALVLGRARRRVVVVDDGRPRNAASRALNGFLTRDGTDPAELRRIALEQLARYEPVQVIAARVTSARHVGDRFTLQTDTGLVIHSCKVILATGLVDHLPAIEGVTDFYGASVFHCPYCDGWEVRDQPLAAIGPDDDEGAGLALTLLQWSADVVFCTNGSGALSPECRARLGRNGVTVYDEPIARLEGRGGKLETIVFADGKTLSRHAAFLSTMPTQRSDLARELGCDAFDPEGCRIERPGRTNVAGLYIIGDASRDALQAIVAAGEGAEAAIAINTELSKASLR